MTLHLKKPWKYVGRDMNWRGAVEGLFVAGLVLSDLAIFGNTTGGYVGVALIAVVGAVILRTASRRHGCAHR